MDYQYTLPVGTRLLCGFYDKERKRTVERTYVIEQVVNGQPLWTGQRVRPGDDVRPVLGQGGFGITYLASREVYDGFTPQKFYYAIKEFFMKGQCYRDKGSTVMKYSPAAKVQVEEGLKDFWDEAKALNDICQQCRNIVKVNEVFDANNTAYYVMEYINGGSLQNRVRQNGPMGEAEALEMIRPVAEALSYVHTKHHLLHCDIKPDNIMLRPNQDGSPDEPVLIDFGIAVHFNKKGELTTTHHIVGTSDGYSPQEQYNGIATLTENRRRAVEEGIGIKGQQVIPCEVDVYALGATLYYLLTAKKPYSAFMMTPEIIERNLPENVSQTMREAITNAMRARFAERTQTMEALLRSFQQRYSLPRGFVLRGKHARYLVTDITGEGVSYLQYKAVPYSETNLRNDGSTTKTSLYTLYEYFDRDLHSRSKDESLSAKDPSKSVPYDAQFIELYQGKTQLEDFGLANIADGHIISESFLANNTSYFVVEQGWKPTPAYIILYNKVVDRAKTIPSTIATHRKPLVTTLAAALAALTLYLAVPPLLRLIPKKAEVAPAPVAIDSTAIAAESTDSVAAAPIDSTAATPPLPQEQPKPASTTTDNAAALQKAKEEAAKKKAKEQAAKQEAARQAQQRQQAELKRQQQAAEAARKKAEEEERKRKELNYYLTGEE